MKKINEKSFARKAGAGRHGNRTRTLQNLTENLEKRKKTGPLKPVIETILQNALNFPEGFYFI